MQFLIEIRPGEGGEDAKQLVSDQAGIYLKAGNTLGVAMEVVDTSRS